MKKGLVFLSVFFLAIMLVGCKSKEKTFQSTGVSVTLDKSFVEKEVIQVPFYLESKDHIFMAARESKSDLSPHGINNLDQYIQAVLNAANKTATTESYQDDNITYKYAYYTSTVNERTYGYMLITMEGNDYFYTINFGCLESNLEKNKDLYTKWSKTIRVE